MSAIISSCGTYRYTLTRQTKKPLLWTKPVLFIMLNPSTADATTDDPTIRRCISFAERELCTELIVVNLFALRATNPEELLTHSDPIGPYNAHHISEAIYNVEQNNGILIAAWGAHPMAQQAIDSYFDRLFGGKNFQCFGKTKNGSPKHPLYLKSTTPLESLGPL